MKGKLEQLTATDGRSLYCWNWRPAGAVRAKVLLLHGIESHAQWFEGTCRWLAKLSFHVVALERRGSGTDAEDRGDINRYRTWLEDVQCVAEHLSKTHPPGKIHLIGISWGGKLACACAAAGMHRIASIVLISPGLAPKVDVSLATKAKIGWSYLFSPIRRFAIPIGDPGMFTPNENGKKFIQEDVHRLKEVTARFLVENAKLDRFLKKNLSSVRVPAFLLLAENDTIIDKEETRRMFFRFCSQVKKVVEYPGATHTLEFEENPDLWRVDVLAWLDSLL